MKINISEATYVYNATNDQWSPEKSTPFHDAITELVQHLWDITPRVGSIDFASPDINRAISVASAFGGIAYDFGDMRELAENERALIR